jgi:ParB family transcriptional regulator, chromosome partitioning protein
VSRKGLPSDIRMRHDSHYVEELSSEGLTPIGRLISTDLLEPNPEQPRVEIGDLSELAASIQDKGVLEPLLVKPSSMRGKWMIIAGERRWRAARAVGVRELPCIEMDINDREVAEVALIENLQRKDLTPWEEADGLAALCEKYGYTHEDVAKKIGKSRSTVTEALSIATLPEVIREQCRRADIISKSHLLQIVRQSDSQAVEKMIQEISLKGKNRDQAKNIKRERAESDNALHYKPFTFKYKSPNKSYHLEIRFRRAGVNKQEIIDKYSNRISFNQDRTPRSESSSSSRLPPTLA